MMFALRGWVLLWFVCWLDCWLLVVNSVDLVFLIYFNVGCGVMFDFYVCGGCDDCGGFIY